MYYDMLGLVRGLSHDPDNDLPQFMWEWRTVQELVGNSVMDEVHELGEAEYE